MSNKKAALIFAPLVLVLMVVGLIWAWSEVRAKHDAFNEKLGEKQFKLINTYQEGEKALFYIDQSAKYSAYQSVHNLSENGGCVNGEKYSGYTLWNINYETLNNCLPTPESSKNNFFSILLSNLNNYLSKYNTDYLLKYDTVKLLSDNYDFIYDSNILVGIAKEKLEIPIIGKETDLKSSGTYYINPSFKVKVGHYDFTDYRGLVAIAEQFVAECENKYPNRCVEENKNHFFNQGDFELESCEPGDDVLLDEIQGPEEWKKYRIFGFCVKSNNNEFYVYDEDAGNIVLRNVVYKFALPFEYLSCSNDDYEDTHCREFSCGDYYDCGVTDVCFCSQHPVLPNNACEGECPLCKPLDEWNVGECDEGICVETERQFTRTYMPSVVVSLNLK